MHLLWNRKIIPKLLLSAMRPPQNCKAQLCLLLLRKINSKIIFVCICICDEIQKRADQPNFRKNAFGVKRPFSELSEKSGAALGMRNSILGIRNSILGLASHDLRAIRKPQFSEQFPEQLPELMGAHMKYFHLPLHSHPKKNLLRQFFLIFLCIESNFNFWGYFEDPQKCLLKQA